MLDAKHFTIRKKAFTLYMAFDAVRRRPLCWLLLPRHELREGYDRILKRMSGENVRIDGIVSDQHPGIKASLADWYPDAIHQHCAFHVLADILRRLGGKSFLARGGRGVWKRIRHVALGCSALHDARQHLGALRRTHPIHARIWDTLAHHLPGIYQFTKQPALLGAYRTSNRIENCMGVIEQRVKTFRSMKSPDQCANIISSFIKIKYR